MSTAAQVQAAWVSAIWNHATIQALTTKIYGYDITQGSEFEIAKLKFGGEVNCIVYSVTSAYVRGMTEQHRVEFTVKIEYLRFADIAGSNWAAVRDFFDTLYPLVDSQLGEDWGHTVDFWEPQEGPAAIEQITLDDEQVHKGTYQYKGIQTVIN